MINTQRAYPPRTRDRAQERSTGSTRAGKEATGWVTPTAPRAVWDWTGHRRTSASRRRPVASFGVGEFVKQFAHRQVQACLGGAAK